MQHIVDCRRRVLFVPPGSRCAPAHCARRCLLGLSAASNACEHHCRNAQLNQPCSQCCTAGAYQDQALGMPCRPPNSAPRQPAATLQSVCRTVFDREQCATQRYGRWRTRRARGRFFQTPWRDCWRVLMPCARPKPMHRCCGFRVLSHCANAVRRVGAYAQVLA